MVDGLCCQSPCRKRRSRITQYISVPVLELPSGAAGPRRGKGLLRKILIVLAIAVVVAFAAWKIHQNLTEAPANLKKSAGNGDRAVPVLAVRVLQEEMPIYLTEPGNVAAYYSVTIRTRVDGQLLSVNIREGQSVRKGELLAQIDPAPYEAAVAQAEGQLAKDQAAAVYANAAAARYTALYKVGVVSQDREQTQTAAAGQADGAILADKAAIQATKVNLAFTRITSPIDGVVGLRQVDPGNIVHATDATGLFLVTQLQPIGVIFTLPEDQLPEVHRASVKEGSLPVEAYDHAETTLLGTGKLLTLDNQIDTTTGTDKVKAIFDNKDGALFPNQFVNVRLILRRKTDALVIPAAAIQSGSIGSFVYVVRHGDPPKGGDAGAASGSGKTKSGHAGKSHTDKSQSTASGGNDGDSPGSGGKFYVEVRPIVADVTEGAQVIVSSGLSAGEQVVIDGLEKLKDGSPVSPRQSGPKTGGRKSSKSDGTDRAAPVSTQPSTQSGEGTGKHKRSRQGSPQ